MSNLEQEIKEVLKNHRIEKKLENIETLLIQKDLESSSSFSNTYIWLLLAMFYFSGFGYNPETIVKEERCKK